MRNFRYVWIMTLFILLGCGTESGSNCEISTNAAGNTILTCDGESTVVGSSDSGASCTVQDNANGTATIQCDDGTTATVGSDENECSVTQNTNGGATISCDGSDPVTINGDSTSEDDSCSVVQSSDSFVTITCDDGTTAKVISQVNLTESSCTATPNTDGTTTIECPTGDPVDVVSASGALDESCTITDNQNGTVTISCDDDTSVTLNVPFCGNGTIETGENCDDGGESATCNSNCTIASCGDGVVNATDLETCDDRSESATCNSDCTSVRCGDFVINETAGEVCDDGNTNDADACSADCTEENATPICGNILTNTTWGVANSPYVLTCDVGVASGAELTIEPGVELRGGGFDLTIFGTLTAEGTTANPIRLISIDIGPCGDRSTHDHGILTYQHVHVDGGDFYSNTNGCSSDRLGILTLTDSYVTNATSIYVWYPRSNCTVARNIFENTGGFTIGVGYVHSCVFTLENNVFVNQTSSFAIENWALVGNSSSVVAVNNSFLSTDRNALTLDDGDADIIAINNYWGTTDTSTIDTMIYDSNDDLNISAEITYDPILTVPHTNTPAYP